MAAASAIISGVIASILSYRNTKQLETMKSKYNNDLEEVKRKNAIELEELKNVHSREISEQKIKAEHDKEEEFNSRIRELVLLELRHYRIQFNGLLHSTDRAVVHFKLGWEVFAKTPSRYKNMSLERRILVFSPSVLSKVEDAYHWLGFFSNGFSLELDRYLNNEITFEQLIDIFRCRT